MFLDKV
jgi:hypothetical protein